MSSAEHAAVASRLSIAYVMAIVAELLRVTSLDFMDVLLVMTIANVNAAATPPDPKRRPDGPGPFGISRNALSRLLNVPLETVRRRVAGLLDKSVLIEHTDGLVFSPANTVGLGENPALAAFNLEKLRELFRGLKAFGVEFD